MSRARRRLFAEPNNREEPNDREMDFSMDMDVENVQNVQQEEEIKKPVKREREIDNNDSDVEEERSAKKGRFSIATPKPTPNLTPLPSPKSSPRKMILDKKMYDLFSSFNSMSLSGTQAPPCSPDGSPTKKK